jgi:BirA family biotin operon repressor/biotin-[acetyl-CoA-carboxylase] ligase
MHADEPRFLDPDRVKELAVGAVVGTRVVVFRDTASTNELAQRLAEEGAEEGLAIFAERQSRGRGQFGRTWHSADGLGLWFSVLLRPAWTPEELALLTPMVAVAVARAIEGATGRAPGIKPPNDIFFGSRKTAGILTEARSGRTFFAVVGIGINVNHGERDFPVELAGVATSLAIECGRRFDREEVAAGVLRELDAAYRRLGGPADGIEEAYAALSRRPICDTLRA